jgi:hypothetical protein
MGSARRAPSGSLNEKIEVEPGFYGVEYGDIAHRQFGISQVYVQVFPGKVTQINLARIEIPRFSRSIKVGVFRDFTSATEREKVVRSAFIAEQVLDTRDYACRHPNVTGNKKICDAFESGDPMRLVGPWFMFDKESGKAGFVYVGDGTVRPRLEWDFISEQARDRSVIYVLPGVYGFAIERDGEKPTVKLGIRGRPW